MSKIVLIGITLFSLLTFTDSSHSQLEEVHNIATPIEYRAAGDDCTVTTHGYVYVDGAAVYMTLSVSGPCDSSLADKVRSAIRALRGIK